jgi:hypothetical protein
MRERRLDDSGNRKERFCNLDDVFTAKICGKIHIHSDIDHGRVVINANADQNLILYLATPSSKVFSHPIKATCI